MDNVEERVRKLLVEHLGVEPEKVTRQAGLIDDLGADSLDIVELVMAAEEEFGCEITDEEADKLSTVDDVICLIEGKKD